MSPRYNTGMTIFRCPCQKLVKFFANFVSRGWQRLVILIFCEFSVVRVEEIVKKFGKKLVRRMSETCKTSKREVLKLEVC